MSLNTLQNESARPERKDQLRALLDAEIHLKSLVELLSGGFIVIDSPTAARWAGWIEALSADPAWTLLRPALSSPEAWPEVWDRARSRGFSPRTEHHQAIFFTRLFERAIAESRYNLARRAWEEALLSFRALANARYLEEALRRSDLELSEQELEAALGGLFDSPLSMVGDEALRALHLQNWNGPPLKRPLRFVADLLLKAQEIFPQNAPSSDPLSRGVCAGLSFLSETIHRAFIDEFHRRVEPLDLASVELSELLSLLDGALSRVEILGNPPALDRFLLRQGLAIIWDLREIQRDEALGVIEPFLERLQPIADRARHELGASLERESLGMEGAIADLYVFAGEDALRLDAREENFEIALQVCPGHRNASRLLSYVLLERANRELLKTTALPGAASRVETFRLRVDQILARAGDAIARAAELYPENDLLPRYRDDYAEELRRFGLNASSRQTEPLDEDR